MMKNRWNVFNENMQADLKMFFSVWVILMLFRLIFLTGMQDYLAKGTEIGDILTALYYGGRISLKTAGVIWAISFCFVTLPSVLIGKNVLAKVRLIAGGLYVFLLSILLMAKFPYYQEFHTGFNQMIFNTLQDDQAAIFHTLVAEYQLWWRIAGAAILAIASFYVIGRVLRTKTRSFPGFADQKKNIMMRLICCSILILFAVFIRFGGSLTYAHSLHWENCSLAKDGFLNEIIIDDVQALYRAHSIKKRIDNGMASGVHQDKIKAYLAAIRSGQPGGNEIDDCLSQQAKGAVIKQPNRIFIIIGESYAQWPLLDKYKDLHLADKVKAIMNKENAAYTQNFLPNGAFTPMAVNALISGLSDVNIYPNHQPESYQNVYQTALAPQLKKLGYKTSFWYSGFSSWERIKDFAMAQGFDEFHSAADFPDASGNVWGCDDEYLFQALQSVAMQETAPTVYIILTVSNHAPYSVDLKKAGFDEAKVRNALPEAAKDDQDLLKRLGHYWYTDQLIGAFTEHMATKYPEESLFIITGDHADRTNIDNQPTMFERYTVPLIIYGNGIQQDTLPKDTAGSHVNIGATLIELIAPQGFTYYTLGKSLLGESKVGFCHNLWITPRAIGEIDADKGSLFNETAVFEQERQNAMQSLETMRTISWWRTMKGNAVE